MNKDEIFTIDNFKFNWFGGMSDYGDVKSFELSVYPSTSGNIASFSITLGGNNGISLTKHLANNNYNKLFDIPNDDALDYFCEQIKNFDFKRLKTSQHVLLPQEEDAKGMYKISYTYMNTDIDNMQTVEINNPNNQGIIRLCLGFIMGHILKDKEFRNLLLKYSENKQLNALNDLLSESVDFDLKEDYKLDDFEQVSSMPEENIISKNQNTKSNKNISFDDLINDIDKKLEELDNQ